MGRRRDGRQEDSGLYTYEMPVLELMEEIRIPEIVLELAPTS
jgi:hypothetical protein